VQRRITSRTRIGALSDDREIRQSRGRRRTRVRIGIGMRPTPSQTGENYTGQIEQGLASGPCGLASYRRGTVLSPDHVWQLARAVEIWRARIMLCYAWISRLLFPGLRPCCMAVKCASFRTICHAGKKATMVVRKDARAGRSRKAHRCSRGNRPYISLSASWRRPWPFKTRLRRFARDASFSNSQPPSST